MRLHGRLTEWNDDRGFGFITPLDGQYRVFVHVSEFPRDRRRPIAMDLVTYTVDEDERGRSRAREVLFMAPTGHARVAKPSSFFTLRLLFALVVSGLLFGVLLFASLSPISRQVNERLPTSRPASPSDQAIASAFQNHTSGIQVAGQGVVERVLSDDNDGSRHQRFILRLASGQTLLVAHNIDIAPRINALSPGDTVAFNGVYEWNPKGGVIHWTHHDPAGRHAAGWLRHNGTTFQ